MASEWEHLGLQLADRYRIDEPLARGACCVVYRGQDTVLRRSVVIKTVAPDLAAMYQQALGSSSAFTHPGAVATYDALSLDGWFFVIQEYVAARPFATYLRNGLPVERTLNLGGQIARILAYAHAHNITHGDLTPAAVLVDRHAFVRLNNFCMPSDQAYFSEIRATLEQDAAHGDIVASGPTPANDVYALGLLLWQALSEEEDADTRRRVFRADVPERLRESVRRSVDHAHADHIITAETLALELDTISQALARERPQIPEQTPPAVRAARDEVAREAAWSVRETLGNLYQWGNEDSRSYNAPTDPIPMEAIAPQTPYARAQHVAAGAPRLQLPSRPLSAATTPATAVDPSPYARSNPAIADAADTNPIDMRPGRSGMSVAFVILLGIILFVAFFLIGFLSPGIFHIHL